MKIAHLTDVHFGASDATVVAALLEDLRAEAPDVVAITGDLTQSATRDEFAQVRDFLAQTPGEAVIVPGNHDVPARALVTRLTRPWSRFREYVGETEPQRIIGDVAFAGINSARRARAGWNWSLGAVSATQIERALGFLRRSGASCRVLAIHHPLLALGGQENQRAMAGGRRLVEGLIEAGVELVLCGHSHRQMSIEVNAITASHRLLILQSSTATSSRRRGERNGYTMVKIAPGQVAASARVYEEGAFSSVAEKTWTR